MDLAALIFWLLTAAGGAYMLGISMRAGAGTSTARESHLPPLVVFSHAGLALFGLAVWGVYMSIEDRGVAWLAFAVLVVVALLGSVLLHRWLRTRRGPRSGAELDEHVAEQQIPVPAVVGHGVAAALTIVLVLLTALGVGGTTGLQ